MSIERIYNNEGDALRLRPGARVLAQRLHGAVGPEWLVVQSYNGTYPDGTIQLNAEGLGLVVIHRNFAEEESNG